MVKLAFATNDQEKGWISSVICVLTRSKVYHCELVFPQGSCVVDWKHGVYFLNRKYDYYGWHVLPLPMIDEPAGLEMYHECKKLEGTKYDYVGAILGGFCHNWENPKRWFCSELCAHFLRPYIPTLKPKQWYSPEILWHTVSDYLTQQGLEQ